MNWLWFIPILLIMVVLHELGHFLTARYFGMTVHEFGIGFPPKVWSRKSKSGVEWSINALPIGGFVRIEGENGDSNDPNSFGKKAPWKRAIVLAAGPAMNLILAFVLYFGISAFGGKTVADGRPAVLEVRPNSPAAAAGLQPGDIFVTVNSKPVVTTSDITLETALEKNNPVQLVMDRNGTQFSVSILPRKNPPEGEGALGVSLQNVVGADQLLLGKSATLNKQLGLTGDDAFQEKDAIVSIDGKPLPNNVSVFQYLQNDTNDSITLTTSRNGQTYTHTIPLSAQVETVYSNSSAANQNLPVGAIITQLDSTPIHNIADYNNYINANAGKQITLYYKPDINAAQALSIGLQSSSLDPNASNRAPEVGNASIYLIAPTHHVSYNPAEAAGDAWNQTIFAIDLIPRTFKGLFDGSISTKNLAGPIGMAQITDTVVAQGSQGGFWSLMGTLAALMAMLSVNLGIVNILPLPALDGGRLVFVIIEMVTRGKRVPPEKEGLVHLVGMVALLSLMALIAWQDVIRLVSGGSFQ